MKLRKLFTLLSVLTLTACEDIDNSLLNKTFIYRNKLYYKFDVKDFTYITPIKTIIQEQMAANNIAWESSGFVSEGLLSKEIKNFAKTTSYSDVISSMETLAFEYLDENFKDGFEIETKKGENATATLTIGDSINECTLTPSDKTTDVSEAIYLYIMEGERNVGHLSMTDVYGSGVFNGKFDCVEVSYKGISNKINFLITFKKDVKLNGIDYPNISFEAYGKINN